MNVFTLLLSLENIACLQDIYNIVKDVLVSIRDFCCGSLGIITIIQDFCSFHPISIISGVFNLFDI